MLNQLISMFENGYMELSVSGCDSIDLYSLVSHEFICGELGSELEDIEINTISENTTYTTYLRAYEVSRRELFELIKFEVEEYKLLTKEELISLESQIPTTMFFVACFAGEDGNCTDNTVDQRIFADLESAKKYMESYFDKGDYKYGNRYYEFRHEGEWRTMTESEYFDFCE